MNSLEKLISGKNIWFKDPNDCLYLTKFNSSNLNVFYINEKWYVITDDRYIFAAKKEIKKMEVLNMNEMPFKNKLLPEILASKKSLFIDENNFTLKEYKGFIGAYPKLKLESINLSNIRTIKSRDEIEIIKKACEITDQIFDKFLKEVKSGISEKKLEKILLKLIIDSEADNISFWPIIAAGVNSSSPHWKASSYILKDDDILTIDFGVKYKNYVSDMTRTFSVKGKLSNEEEKIHSLTLKVANLAIEKAKIGIDIKELDILVKNELKKEGYDKYFTHALGHGIGVEVHENPLIFSNSSGKLEENMVITIEPGIYITNKYGCRIEQDILITKDGAVELNKANKNLYII